MSRSRFSAAWSKQKSRTLSFEEDDLHNATLLPLNIQNDTSARSRTNNRIVIESINTTRVTNPVWMPKVPTIMLANIMSLAPKMDEVSEFILRHNTSLAFITETRLKDSVRWHCTNSRVRGGAKGQESN